MYVNPLVRRLRDLNSDAYLQAEANRLLRPRSYGQNNHGTNRGLFSKH